MELYTFEYFDLETKPDYVVLFIQLQKTFFICKWKHNQIKAFKAYYFLHRYQYVFVYVHRKCKNIQIIFFIWAT